MREVTNPSSNNQTHSHLFSMRFPTLSNSSLRDDSQWKPQHPLTNGVDKSYNPNYLHSTYEEDWSYCGTKTTTKDSNKPQWGG